MSARVHLKEHKGPPSVGQGGIGRGREKRVPEAGGWGQLLPYHLFLMWNFKAFEKYKPKSSLLEHEGMCQGKRKEYLFILFYLSLLARCIHFNYLNTVCGPSFVVSQLVPQMLEANLLKILLVTFVSTLGKCEPVCAFHHNILNCL